MLNDKNVKTLWNIFNMQNRLKQTIITWEKNVATNKKYILRKLDCFQTFTTPHSMF